MKKILILLVLFLFLWAYCNTPLHAAQTADPKANTTEEKLLTDAKDVFSSINNSLEMGIPRGLVYTAQAIAIFPKTQGGGVVVGGMGGRGVILYKEKDDKWSSPAFLRISGASFGFQFGFQEVDIVLVLMDKTNVDGLLKSKIKLGVDAGVSAGPVGRDASIGTDLQARGIVYSYSKSRGVYVGLKLSGSTISPDEAANKALYGENYTTEDIIIKNKVKPSMAGQALIKTIVEYTKK